MTSKLFDCMFDYTAERINFDESNFVWINFNQK